MYDTATMAVPLTGDLPMPDAATIAAYRRDGFVRLGRLLDAAGVDLLRRELDRVIATQDDADCAQPTRIANLGLPDRPVWQIVNIWQGSPAFAALCRLPSLMDALASLSGAAQLRLWHDQIQYKPAGTGGVNRWHQDAPYWPPIMPQTCTLTAWIALDDADTANGCMRMVPGSHLWGDAIDRLHAMQGFDDLPETYAGHAVRAMDCPVPVGCVHVHHGLTWHGSPDNRSARPRRAIAIHVMTEAARHRAVGRHLLSPAIRAADGEPFAGDLFPILWPAGTG